MADAEVPSLVDSNILVYAFDKDEEIKNKAAKDLLRKVVKNELSIVLSTQNLSEFYFSVTKKIGKSIPPEQAKEIIIQLISLDNVEVFKIKEATILDAIDMSVEFSLSYWDSLITAVMRENNIDTMITENEKDFSKIPWLNVVNLFRN